MYDIVHENTNLYFKDKLLTKNYECDNKVQKLYDKDTWSYYCEYKHKWFKKGICLDCKYNKE